MFFLCLSRKCAEEQRHGGKESDWCGDQWKDHDGLFMFYLYTCFYRLVLESVRADFRARAKCLSSV